MSTSSSSSTSTSSSCSECIETNAISSRCVVQNGKIWWPTWGAPKSIENTMPIVSKRFKQHKTLAHVHVAYGWDPCCEYNNSICVQYPSTRSITTTCVKPPLDVAVLAVQDVPCVYTREIAELEQSLDAREIRCMLPEKQHGVVAQENNDNETTSARYLTMTKLTNLLSCTTHEKLACSHLIEGKNCALSIGRMCTLVDRTEKGIASADNVLAEDVFCDAHPSLCVQMFVDKEKGYRLIAGVRQYIRYNGNDFSQFTHPYWQNFGAHGCRMTEIKTWNDFAEFSLIELANTQWEHECNWSEYPVTNTWCIYTDDKVLRSGLFCPVEVFWNALDVNNPSEQWLFQTLHDTLEVAPPKARIDLCNLWSDAKMCEPKPWCRWPRVFAAAVSCVVANPEQNFAKSCVDSLRTDLPPQKKQKLLAQIHLLKQPNADALVLDKCISMLNTTLQELKQHKNKAEMITNANNCQ